MTKILFLLFISLFTKSISTQWVLDYQFTNGTIGVTSISVTDTNYIWLCTIDSLLTRHVFKKSDQIVINVNTIGISNPRKIIAVDTSKAFLNASDNRLYSTTNSGINWRICLDSTLWGYDFSLSRKSTNFIIAGTSIHDSDKSALFISTNSGFNWTRQTIPFTEEYLIFDVKNTDPAHIYVGMNCPSGSCGNLQYLYTSNGGINWQFKNFPLVSNNMTLLAPVFNVHNTIGFTFAVGFNFYRYKTTNSGFNWSLPEFFSLGNTEGMQGIVNIDSTSVWFCATSQKVYKTTNDGINWSEMTIPLTTGEFITGIDFIRKENKYYGYVGTGSENGKIYKLIETISPIGIHTISTEIPKSYSLSQNYPNPFNPVTKLKFSLPQSGNVRLTVYDALGKEVMLLVNENLQAGIYETDLDASNIPSGVYFYRLEVIDPSTSLRETETKKMVVVK